MAPCYNWLSALKRGIVAKVTGLPYSRIVAKLGTNLLTGGGEGLDLTLVRSLVEQLAGLHRQGVQVIVVTSGAIAVGRQVLGLSRVRKDVPFKQVLAAVGQGRLMQTYQEFFGAHDVKVAQALIANSDLDDREGYLNVRNTLNGLLELGVVPIVNENDVVAIQEIGPVVFGDNDHLSAMIANLVDADLLAILSDIDGLYTSDPRRNPHAELLSRVEQIDRRIEGLAGGKGSNRGRGGMVTKLQAAKTATSSGVVVAVANGRVPDVLPRLARGEAIGTLFEPTATRLDSRRRWMLSGAGSRGRIVVDAGAAYALTTDHRSLLPAGILSVHGDFGRGDLVEICDEGGGQVGCGLTNYSALELGKIKGLKTGEAEKLLGYKYSDEVVHRNDMVLIEPSTSTG